MWTFATVTKYFAIQRANYMQIELLSTNRSTETSSPFVICCALDQISAAAVVVFQLIRTLYKNGNVGNTLITVFYRVGKKWGHADSWTQLCEI